MSDQAQSDQAHHAPGGPETPRLRIRLLHPGDEEALQAVFRAAGDHFLSITGRPEPDPDAAAQEIRGCAATPGRDVALVTLRETGEAVGALGWWRGNPAPDLALLGMLLVAPAHRGRGIAREALGALEGWLRERGVGRLRTGVATHDRRAAGLLPALGFARLGVREHAALGLSMVHLTLWEKALG
jgi:RimJ/RimL family protein N-acetyltransferase